MEFLRRILAGGRSTARPKGVTSYEAWALGHTDPSRFDSDVLFTRLQEVARWCDRFKQVSEFRCNELQPRILHDGPDDAVCEVGHSRSRELKFKQVPLDEGPPRGKLLAYFPDAELSDGFAETVSEGFFDVNNAPPFDTWVAFLDEGPGNLRSFRKYLLCYVPESFSHQAEAGIEGNPEECIVWLDQVNVKFRARVAEWRKSVGGAA